MGLYPYVTYLQRVYHEVLRCHVKRWSQDFDQPERHRFHRVDDGRVRQAGASHRAGERRETARRRREHGGAARQDRGRQELSQLIRKGYTAKYPAHTYLCWCVCVVPCMDGYDEAHERAT